MESDDVFVEVRKWEQKKQTSAGTLVVAVRILLETEGHMLTLETRRWLKHLLNEYEEAEQKIIKLLKE